MRGRIRGAVAVLVVALLTLAGPVDAQQPPELELPHMEWGTTAFLLIDQLEVAPTADDRPVALDAAGWWGGAYNRAWFRLEGEQLTTESIGEVEGQLLYGRTVAPFWDALVGVRVDRRWGNGADTRAHFAVGLEGLAPYWFELAPTLFVSQDGDLSARLEAEYELLLTQRAVLTPELELNAALTDVPEWEIGAGLNDYELGLRLRYEIRRELAPYAGWVWARRLGKTADIARDAGGEIGESGFVAGLRMWF